MRIAAWSAALLLSSGAANVANAYAPKSSWSPSTSLSSPSFGVILRIRLSDGKVVRLETSGDNTVRDLLSKLVGMGHNVGGGLVILPSKKCMSTLQLLCVTTHNCRILHFSQSLDVMIRVRVMDAQYISHLEVY